MAQIRKGALEVQGYGIVGNGWDAFLLECLCKGVPIFCQNCVLGINRRVSRGDNRGLDTGDSGKQLIVAPTHLSPKGAFFWEEGKLFQKYGSLKGIQPTVDAYQGMLVFDFLAMNTDLAHLVGQ